MEKTKAITSMMEENRVFNPSEETSQDAYIKSLDEYREIYLRLPGGFLPRFPQGSF